MLELQSNSELKIQYSMKIPGFDFDLSRDFFLIGGPCVIESHAHAVHMAKEIRDIAGALGMPYIFKASFDKANRTSVKSFRGPGVASGLEVLAAVKTEVGVPVLSDVHEPAQAAAAGSVLDVIQIPAFLCRQTDLLIAAAATGKIVNIKKGQFVSPTDIGHAVEKVRESGNPNVVLTERGSSFGYNNLVVDFRSFPIMQGFGCPVVFDVTHSLQLPGGQGNRSGGQPEFIPVLARAGVAAGVDGVFMEIHDNPREALSDGPNALDLSLLSGLLEELLAVRQCLKRT
jgi:2-dehydro-3-deoxyphosphooctonate aldolase (KDO 8-P synthase)